MVVFLLLAILLVLLFGGSAVLTASGWVIALLVVGGFVLAGVVWLERIGNQLMDVLETGEFPRFREVVRWCDTIPKWCSVQAGLEWGDARDRRLPYLTRACSAFASLLFRLGGLTVTFAILLTALGIPFLLIIWFTNGQH